MPTHLTDPIFELPTYPGVLWSVYLFVFGYPTRSYLERGSEIGGGLNFNLIFRGKQREIFLPAASSPFFVFRLFVCFSFLFF